MSTNFLQFDPNATNAETDSQYLADTIRQNGGASGEIFPSPLMNKAYIQWSNFVAAFCQSMANKGFNIADLPFSSLVAVLAHVKTSADFPDSIIQVAYATSITFSAAAASGFDLTLTGNVSASTLTGFSAGQLLIFWIQQDATGGRTFVWPSALSGTSPICPQPNCTSVQLFQVRANATTIMPVSPMLWITASGVILTNPLPYVWPSVITINGTVASGYARIVEKVDVTGGNVTRSLYSAVGASGAIITIKRNPGDVSTNLLNVATVLGQTIDGFSSWGPIQPSNSFDFMSDNANWILV